jgi:hypothetical protein
MTSILYSVILHTNRIIHFDFVGYLSWPVGRSGDILRLSVAVCDEPKVRCVLQSVTDGRRCYDACDGISTISVSIFGREGEIESKSLPYTSILF